MNHMMIDLETLDTKNSAMVLSLGACCFNGESLIQSLDSSGFNNKLYIELDLKDQEVANRTISIDTLEWWLKQSPGLEQFNIKALKKYTLSQTVTVLDTFILENKIDCVWSNGPSFDMVIIESIYNSHSNRPFMIKYSNWFDFKTIRYMRKLLKMPEIETEIQLHNSLNDAMYQAMIVNNTLIELKRNYNPTNFQKPNDDPFSSFNDMDLIIDMNG
jgi:hypothetical protein